LTKIIKEILNKKKRLKFSSDKNTKRKFSIDLVDVIMELELIISVTIFAFRGAFYGGFLGAAFTAFFLYLIWRDYHTFNERGKSDSTKQRI
ncbi:MAG: hypothetical protein ACFE9L_08800, partial [Candidatus Hodarchaeota archaeon]